MSIGIDTVECPDQRCTAFGSLLLDIHSFGTHIMKNRGVMCEYYFLYRDIIE